MGPRRGRLPWLRRMVHTAAVVCRDELLSVAGDRGRSRTVPSLKCLACACFGRWSGVAGVVLSFRGRTPNGAVKDACRERAVAQQSRAVLGLHTRPSSGGQALRTYCDEHQSICTGEQPSCQILIESRA